jgi:DNA-binding response OmpR family regulator
MSMQSLSDRSAFRRAHSVLVVDDNPSMKYAVARHLRAGGYNTVEASGGAEALELSEFVSAVVLDVHLPDLDGFEVCRLLRARESTSQLPVIHMSAERVEAADAATAAECGTDGFLAIPLNPAELTSTLDRLITERAQARPPRDGDAELQSPGARSGAGVRSILDQMTVHERKDEA